MSRTRKSEPEVNVRHYTFPVELKDPFASAMQFDGKNSKHIATWINNSIPPGGLTEDDRVTTAKAGGTYIAIYVHGVKTYILKKGMWIIYVPQLWGWYFTTDKAFNDSWSIQGRRRND